MLPRLQSGQPASTALSARVLNEAFRSIEQKSVAAGVSIPASPVIAIVKNTGTDPINIYHPCGIGDSLNEHPDGVDVSVLPMLFEAIEPTAENIWGITQSAIGPGQAGPVMLLGLTWAYLGGRPSGSNFGTPSTGFDPLDGAASGRFQILSSATTGTTRLFAGVLIPQSSAECNTSYDLFILGDPSGGNITLPVTYNAVTENIVIPYNSSDSDIKTLIDAHSEFVIATVECTVTSTGPGGVLPGNNMIIGLPSGATMTLSPTNTLVRRAGGFYPTVNLRLCGCQ